MNTNVVKINPELVELDKIQIIAQTLDREGIIAYPTDTFYGLGANCFSKKAIRRIYRLKKRKVTMPLSVVISDRKVVRQIASSIPSLFWTLSREFWPGPLTLILRAKPQFPEEFLGPGQTLGVRLPDLDWLRELLRQVGFPITATSANISGEREIALPEEIVKTFGNKVDLIVDGGKTPGVLPSTVVDLTSEVPKILREGALPSARLRRYLRV